MDIQLARPQKKDEETIKKLFTTVVTHNFKEYGFYEKYRKDIAYEVAKQMSALQRALESNGKDVYFLIAWDKNEIIGTIAYSKPSSDIKKYYTNKLENIPEIRSAYVLPDYQGKGVGTMLFNAIIKVLQQNGFTEFCLDSGYPKAQKFWEKKLGPPVVKVTNRWSAGNDYLIWHHKLP